MPTILDTIVEANRGPLEEEKQRVPQAEIIQRAREQDPPRPFIEALLAGPRPALIAEVKKAAPRDGDFGLQLSPVELARLYAQHGAACISVLTEPFHFKGSLDDLVQVRAAVTIPVLRKDFIFDPYQVYAARAAGADAILLIMAMLEDDQVKELSEIAEGLDMDVLVEVHNEEEVQRALKSDARLIGINNRDLRTFTVDLATTQRLRSLIPPDRVCVSESGILTAADVTNLIESGCDAMLVGRALVSGGDPVSKLAELTGAQAKRD